MANDFVNTITTSNGTTYDVQDKRLTVTASDAGKVVSVDSEGNLVLVEASAGGTKLYRHVMTYSLDKLTIISSSPDKIISARDDLQTRNLNLHRELENSCEIKYYNSSELGLTVNPFLVGVGGQNLNIWSVDEEAAMTSYTMPIMSMSEDVVTPF